LDGCLAIAILPTPFGAGGRCLTRAIFCDDFGKADFAFKVVQVKASTIDFSGFSPLLERIEKVIAHQAERLTEATNANPTATVPTATP
jgi:hypothetical protein